MDFKVIDEMGCVMDHGGEDYYLFACEKDGKYGLLLPNGMYVEPIYDDYMPDDEEGEVSVHVRKSDEYGVFMAPDYEYRGVVIYFKVHVPSPFERKYKR